MGWNGPPSPVRTKDEWRAFKQKEEEDWQAWVDFWYDLVMTVGLFVIYLIHLDKGG